MCGVFAYKGTRKNTAEIILKGIKTLEYRGYDSWGIALKQDGHFTLEKHVGKISAVEQLPKTLTKQPSSCGVGHSRWATHGGVTDNNAHPHIMEDDELVIVHNGVFENYQEIKDKMIKKGHKFTSETDTEAFGHLLENIWLGAPKKGVQRKPKMDLANALQAALAQMKGRFAVLVLAKQDERMIAARRGSPLIVGVGKNEYFIASDVPAFLPYTKTVMYLDDNQMVAIGNRAIFYDLKTGTEIKKRQIPIEWQMKNMKNAEKGKYAHFMIKEIMEQKETIYHAINQDQKIFEKAVEMIKKAYGTYLVGCGTAGKVCLAAEYFFAEIAHRHVNVAFGSEFRKTRDFLTDKSLVIAVSQSGETADTLEALEIAKKKGAKIIAIVNVESSTMARMADLVIPLKVGPEKAVASTKATTAQLAILMLLAYTLNGQMQRGRFTLLDAASNINDMLNPRYEAHIQNLAKKIKKTESMTVIGKGAQFPMALEAAIKLQEVSYIHAEGFAGGELKHGPIALISRGTPCIVLTANNDLREEILSNAQEVKARGGMIIGVGPKKEVVFDYWLRVPDVGQAAPIISIIPIQILAYHLALLRNNDPDMPRNLAKSVTVK